MGINHLSVREIEKEDIERITDYWLNASEPYLKGMGADINKVPPKKDLAQMLEQQLRDSYEEKKSYCIIWLFDGKPIGHCNVNKIIFGDEASMLLLIWHHEF